MDLLTDHQQIAALQPRDGNRFAPREEWDSDRDGSGLSDVVSARKREFLEAYAEAGNIRGAAAACGLHRWTMYRWAAEDAEFAAAIRQVRENLADDCEHSLYKRAVSDAPGMAPVVAAFGYLKAQRPAQWMERHVVIQHDSTGVDAVRLLTELVSRRHRGAEVVVEGEQMAGPSIDTAGPRSNNP